MPFSTVERSTSSVVGVVGVVGVVLGVSALEAGSYDELAM